MLRGAGTQLMTSKSKSLNKIGGLDAHFFMMSIVQEATEGGHCNTIRATLASRY